MLSFGISDLANFDDGALHVFLDPRDGGVDPDDLGRALQGSDATFAARVAAALDDRASQRFRVAHATQSTPHTVDEARRRVLDALFWPLLYWNAPDRYEELIAGEEIHPAIIDALDVDGRVVCDIGAGTGRFTLPVARRARRVIAVDAVPMLLGRLERHAEESGVRNIDLRRGSFTTLPLEDGSVDLAVACSSFTPSGPHGGLHAVREAERVTRPDGAVAVIWPQQPDWFEAQGFEYLRFDGDDVRHFRSLDSAERLCRDFYSEEAVEWVRAHHSPDVPFRILNTSPPNDVCIKRRAAIPSR